MDGNRILWICDAAPGVAAWLPRRTDWRVECQPAAAALNALPHDCAAIILDFPMRGWTPSELLGEVKGAAPEVPVLIRDPDATLSDAARLARLGAWQFLTHDEDPTAPIEQAIRE